MKIKSSLLVRTALLSFLASGITAAAYAQSYPFEGVWITEKGDSKIQVYKASNNTYAAKIIWFAPRHGEDMQTKKDSHNPKEALRTRPLLGLTIISGLRYTEKNDYEKGRAYDPSSGKTYDCKVTVNSPEKMTMRGFIGFSLIGKSVAWKRVSN